MWQTATIRQPGYLQLLSEVTGMSLASDREGMDCVERIIHDDGQHLQGSKDGYSSQPFG
jgi:hypothetical protein